MINLKIASFNVWGIGDNNKRRNVFTWLREKQMNVYFLQETRCVKEKGCLWEAEWGNKCLFSSANRAAQGVMIMFADNFQYNIKKIKHDLLGRYLIAHIETDKENIVLTNVYGPNSDNPVFFENLFSDLDEFVEYPLIIAGDFNICLTEKDKKGGRFFELSHRQSRETLKEYINNFELVDIWRILNENKQQFSWRQRGLNISCRLDYFLISTNLVNITEQILITNGFRSDHSLISITLSRANTPRGPGFYKLNTSLLLDNNYKQIIHNIIIDRTRAYREQNLSADLLWEMVKMDIRGESIKYSKNKNKEKNKRNKEIEKELDELEQLREGPNKDVINTRINELKVEQEELYNTKIQGILTRAKVRWLKDGEKNTKYFIGLEKRNYLNKSISCLINERGEQLTGPKEILNEEKHFYQNLYEERNVDLDNENLLSSFFKDSDNIKKLDENMKNKCDGLITKDECKQTIQSMSNFKSPGTDGLPIEFYKIFWNDISDILIEAFNYVYSNQNLSNFSKTGYNYSLTKKG